MALTESETAYRTPPHNLEAEQALLGAIFVNNAAYHRIGDFLKAEHFAEGVHGRIYEAASKLIDAGHQANPVTLRLLFDQDPALEQIGGAKYLVRLAASVVTIINVADYGHTIYDAYIRRQLINLADDLSDAAYSGDIERPGTMLISEAEETLYNLAEKGDAHRAGFRQIGELSKTALARAEVSLKQRGRIRGTPTGLYDLDKLIGGLIEGELIVIGARPSMGKAQPFHSKIKTLAGWTTMGAVHVGQQIASPDGSPSVVTGKFPQGDKSIYRVVFQDGRSAECCGDHLWRIFCKRWPERFRVLPLKEIQRLLTIKRYRGELLVEPVTGDFGASDGLPIPPYLLGVLIGDGALVNNFRIASADQAILDRCGALLLDGYHLRHVAVYDYALVKKRRGGPNIYKDAMRDLGLLNKPSNAKFIPPTYLAASLNDRLELMRGLLDTDGTVERDGTIRISTVSPRLALDIRDLAWSLGSVVRISERRTFYTYKGERRTGQISYTISVRHNAPNLLLTLPRKVARLPKKGRRVRIRIADIEFVGVAAACCISTSHRDGLYITDDYLPTHNTTLAQAIAKNAARFFQREFENQIAPRRSVAFFSLEMSSDKIAARELAEGSGVSTDRQRKGDLLPQDFDAMMAASDRLANLPYFVDDTPQLNVAKIRHRARRLARKDGLGLIVVDHLQKMRQGGKIENRRLEIGDITNGLASLAKELGVPVLLLSQLSRAVESRDDKRPTLADLRESGDIEQDADIVLFLYRHEYYLSREEPSRKPDESDEKFNDRYERWKQALLACHNLTQIIAAKNRDGALGKVEVTFNPERSRFENLAREHELV